MFWLTEVPLYIFSSSEIPCSRLLSLTSSIELRGSKSSSSGFAVVLDDMSPTVTVIAAPIEIVELVLVDDGDDVDSAGIVDKVVVVVVVLFAVADVAFVVVAVVVFTFFVVFAVVGGVVVVDAVTMRLVVTSNILRFVLFLIILLSSSPIEVGGGALPEMFQVVAD